MVNQSILLVLAIIALVGILGWAFWTIVVGIKNKNNENFEKVLLRSKSHSSSLLWYAFVLWAGFSTFLDKDIKFSISNVSIIVMFLLGLQCAIELLAGMYYKKKMNLD
ncbi:MAG: hypothetical protein K5769_05530 [Pseudobutyrivibrio sp.]|nr:hypothetical protein [Pseudobutyrivibrio sp.]